MDSSALFEADPIYLQPLVNSAASFVANPVKPVLFHVASLFSRRCAFLDKLHQVHETVPGVKHVSFIALLNLEIQHTAKTSHSTHRSFIITMRLVEYAAKDKCLSSPTKVEVREKRFVVQGLKQLSPETALINKRFEKQGYLGRDTWSEITPSVR